MSLKKFTIIFLTLIFILLTFFVVTKNSFVLDFDNYIITMTIPFHSPSLNIFMVRVTELGNIFQGSIIFLLLGLILIIKKQRESLYTLVISVLSGTILVETIKILVGRERPVSHMLIESDSSFPSGHTILSTLYLCISLVLIAPLIENKFVKRAFILLSSILFPLIALSRIYLSVHFLSDVVAGAILGILCFMVTRSLVKHYFLCYK